MCLLTLALGAHPDLPLIVAANRDEWLDRPAAPVQVLETAPRIILGGRDLLAAGTWLAVNDAGVVAGLTNKPAPNGRSTDKRSRGVLPLIATRQANATEAVAALTREVRPAEYNPCWLLIGDRREAFYVDLTGTEVHSERLGTGPRVLENRPLHAQSAKAEAVRATLTAALAAPTATLVERLGAMLSDHTVPARLVAEPNSRSDSWRPLATEAACVHAGPYGTRSATVVLVPASGRPRLWSSDGPPCRAPLTEKQLWPVA